MSASPLDAPRVFALRARLVFPVVGPPLADAFVVVRDGMIQSVRTVRPADVDSIVELGDVALLPGLVNCHTHLEFSDLTQPLGRPRMPFPSWIGAVIAHRRAQATAGEMLPLAERVKRGWEECRQQGTVLVGEIATAPWPIEVNDDAIDVTVFRELLGLDPSRANELCRLADEHLSQAVPLWQSPALSPHAPYTVSLEMAEALARLAGARGAGVAMHLAESPDEGQLLDDHRGPFRDLLESVGAWFPSAVPRGTRYRDYLQRLSLATRALVIHGNYLASDDWSWLAARRATMSVVYCPRTHAYFDNPTHPFRDMQRCGVRVALGTDSRASNPDLSLFEELRWLAQKCGDVAPDVLLRMATLDGAEALGRAEAYGSLEPGKRARFACIRLADTSCADPYEQLWQGTVVRPPV